MNSAWAMAGFGVLLAVGMTSWLAATDGARADAADPLSANPATNDYTLKPDSPAFRLGFRAIDTSTVGRRKRNAPR